MAQSWYSKDCLAEGATKVWLFGSSCREARRWARWNKLRNWEYIFHPDDIRSARGLAAFCGEFLDNPRFDWIYPIVDYQFRAGCLKEVKLREPPDEFYAGVSVHNID